jgi:hypothetical protein
MASKELPFKATRYQTGAPTYADGSDSLGNRGFIISFFHIPSKKDVSFKAFITAFNETYTSDWASESLYGRGDPIHMFKNTRRNITLAFKIPAATDSEAFENLGRVQTLLQFLYPGYTDTTSGTTIAQSPLVRIKVMNLLASRNAPQSSKKSAEDALRGGEVLPHSPLQRASVTFKDVIESRNPIGSDPKLGALSVIKNITVQHHLEDKEGVLEYGKGMILPKLLDINLSFDVIHEHPLGWQDGKFGDSNTQKGELFPYGVNLDDSGADPTTNEQLANNSAGSPNKAALDAAALEASLDPEGDAAAATATSEAEIANEEAKLRGALDTISNYQALLDDCTGQRCTEQATLALAQAEERALEIGERISALEGATDV